MASFTLRSTYSQYKEDTDEVASWLAKTARSCGYSGELLENVETESTGPIEPQKPEESKVKATKNGKKQANSTPAASEKKNCLLKTSAFTTLAKFIATSTDSNVQVPDSLFKTLDRAISLRKEYGRSLTSKTVLRGITIRNHKYFVSVLEEVKTILEDFATSSVPGDSSDPTKPRPFGVFSCVFQLLDPDSDTYFEFEPEYKADQFEDPLEVYFAFRCLLEDVHKIRKAVAEIWVGFKGGKYRSVSAALATNTAIDFARQLEQDISGALENCGGFEKIYCAWWFAICDGKGYDVDYRQKPGDDMNFITYDDADPVMFPTYLLLKNFLSVVQEDPKMIPISKPGYFGKVDYTGDWNSKAPRKKYESDKVLLPELLDSLMALIRMAGEKEKGLRIAVETRKICLWNVLSVQILLDIHHCLRGDVVRAFSELKGVGTHLSQSIDNNLERNNHCPTWPASKDSALIEVRESIRDWVENDLVHNFLQRHGSPSTLGEHCHFKNNPIFCGLFQYTLQMRFHVIGVDYANSWGAILYARHLYNALKQEKILEKRWTDMHLLSLLQPDETAFGSKAPKDRKDFLKRYAIMDGVSAASYPPEARRLIQRSQSGLKGFKYQARLARVFMHRYCEGSGRVDFSPDELKKIMEKTITYEEDDDTEEIGEGPWSPVKGTLFSVSKIDKARLRKRAQTLPRLTIPELLGKLSNALHGETGTHEFHFDYLYMHFAAWMMLQTAKNACDAHLQQMFGPNYLQHEYELPGIVGYLLFALANPENVGTDSYVDEKTDNLMSVPFSRVAQAWDYVVDDGCHAIGRMVTQHLEGSYQLFASLES
ncbi:hypothetical protein BC567DRAFT_284952 [Phyllosticta citribraziliensis]